MCLNQIQDFKHGVWCAISVQLWFWKYFHRYHKAHKYLPDDSFQCDSTVKDNVIDHLLVVCEVKVFRFGGVYPKKLFNRVSYYLSHVVNELPEYFSSYCCVISKLEQVVRIHEVSFLTCVEAIRHVWHVKWEIAWRCCFSLCKALISLYWKWPFRFIALSKTTIIENGLYQGFFV